MFLHAMRSPLMRFHVVPASKNAQYDRITQTEMSLAYGSGRISPDSQASERGSMRGGLNHTPQRMSRPGPVPPPLPRPNPPHPPGEHGPFYIPPPASTPDEPPSGQAPSPQRSHSATPSMGYTKKVGRRLNIQLKKGTVPVKLTSSRLWTLDLCSFAFHFRA